MQASGMPLSWDNVRRTRSAHGLARRTGRTKTPKIGGGVTPACADAAAAGGRAAVPRAEDLEAAVATADLVILLQSHQA